MTLYCTLLECFGFYRIDANRFTAAIYEGGRATARCSIFMGSSIGKGIAYSHGDSHSGTSYNEILSVEAEDQALFLRPIGFSMNAERDSKLSEEGAQQNSTGRC